MSGRVLILSSVRRAVGSVCCVACGFLTLGGQSALQAQTPTAPLALQVSVEPAPPGAWAQIKVFAAPPALVAAGSISMDLDAAVFGNIAQAAVFSATGDSTGYANVTGQHVDAAFWSASGGIGQLPELPILVLTVPVLATAAPGAETQLTLDPTGSTWMDPLGNQYSVTVTGEQFTVGGTLSVESITPGGGLFAAGTVVKIDGAGFNASTQVSVDGVSLSSVQLVSPKEIDVTLGGATEMTGKHFHFASASGAAVDYFAAPPSAPSPPPAPFAAWDTQTTLPSAQPLLPLPAFTTAATINDLVERSPTEVGYALLNQNAAPVTVTFQSAGFTDGMLLGNETLVIPANTLYFLYMNDLINSLGLNGFLWITATAPIKGLDFEYTFNNEPPPQPSYIIFAGPLGLAPSSYFPQPLQLPVSPTQIFWSWQQGTPLPAAATVSVSGNFPFQVSVPASSFVPATAINWLNVTPASGTGPATLTVAANPASLKPGVYNAAISITPVIPASLSGALTAQPATISVSLTVSAGPLLSWSGVNGFSGQAGSGPATQTLTVTTNGSPAAFTVSAITSSPGNWLSVSPLEGSTPATLTLAANPGQLPAGNYTGSFTLTGPSNTITVLVTLYIYAPPVTTITAIPPSLSFTLVSGASSSLDQPVVFEPLPVSIATPIVSPSATWLTVNVSSTETLPVISCSASATGLAAGTYQATITVNSTTGNGSVTIPVTLTVLPVPASQAQFTASPATLSLTAPAGQNASRSFQLSSAPASQFFTVSASPSWLVAEETNSAYCDRVNGCMTPATISVGASGLELGLGTYSGRVEIQWATGSLSVPATFIVTSATSGPQSGSPIMAAVLNAASLAPGAMAPGEIITVSGTAIGPYPTAIQIGANGRIATTLNSTQLLISGIPAPLIYASTGQLNAIVPYEVSTSGNATVQVKVNGQTAASWDVPLAPSAPSIFTISATGVGQAAVLNQDNTVNSPSNPAAHGSEIQIFATGEGVTTPAGVTGGITGTETNTPILPVSVTIGGIEAAIDYDGSPPDAVAGLFQVNVLVPADAPSGAAVPIMLKIGDAQSPAGVTIAVR